MVNILEVQDLKTNFYTYEGVVKALDEVNFNIEKGGTLGLVGETGCGKSVTSLSIMRLILPDLFSLQERSSQERYCLT